VRGLSAGGREASLAHAVIDLARRLDLDVVAEGEDAETFAALLAAGTAIGHGSFISTPLAASELGYWLQARSDMREDLHELANAPRAR
jgi:EAL domain-containing protein (putative c-di-GMP-specific phosphodiesterase class I)